MEKKNNDSNPSEITFRSKDKEEILRLSKDGFYYRGERVDDIHNVYERFNEWLKASEITTP